MRDWMSFERRWRDSLMAAMVPASPHHLRPGLHELDLTLFWERFRETAPRMSRFGLRVAVWILMFSPPFLIRRMRTFGGLSLLDRDRLLMQANRSGRSWIRRLFLRLKRCACFAYFADGAVAASFESMDSLQSQSYSWPVAETADARQR